MNWFEAMVLALIIMPFVYAAIIGAVASIRRWMA